MRTSWDLNMNDPEPYETMFTIVNRLSYLAWLVFAVAAMYFGWLGLVS